MANNARKTRKAGKRTRTPGRGNGPASPVRRSQSQGSEKKRRRPDATADPRKNFERYTALARDAAASGDAIQSEHYYQHAEHYLRQMASTQAARDDRATRE